MKDLSKCPLEGIGLSVIDSHHMKFILNMQIMSGPYEGNKVQLLMIMSEEYPIKPPKMLIFHGQSENRNGRIPSLHLSRAKGYMKKWIYLLDNDFHMETNQQCIIPHTKSAQFSFRFINSLEFLICLNSYSGLQSKSLWSPWTHKPEPSSWETKKENKRMVVQFNDRKLYLWAKRYFKFLHFSI